MLNKTGLKLKEVCWDTPILDMDSYRIQASRMPTFINAFKRDQTEFLEEFITHRIKDIHANVVLELVGRTGSGKSYSGMSIASIIDPNIEISRNVRYHLDDILNESSSVEGSICWLLDEVERVWGLGTWRSQSEWSNYIESIRKKQHSIITCTPERKPLGTTMYTLEPLRLSLQDEVCHLAIMDDKNQYLGFVIVSHPKHFIGEKKLVAYEEMKDKYLDRIINRDKGDSIGSMADSILEMYAFDVELSERGFRKLTLGKEHITGSDLVEMINAEYPYLNRNNECMAIAEAVKSRLFLKKRALLRKN